MQDIAARGGAAAAVQADVTDTAAVRTMVKQVERELGPVDVLVCNAAAVPGPGFGALLDVTSEAVETIVLARLRAVLTPGPRRPARHDGQAARLAGRRVLPAGPVPETRHLGAGHGQGRRRGRGSGHGSRPEGGAPGGCASLPPR